jgi:hypothetical protein
MSALRIENAYYLLALITALGESCMCDIFEWEIVSKHFIQLRIRNKGRPISPDKRPMRLVFVFLKHLYIYRCSRSKSSFFGKRKMTYYTLQRQHINKHVLDLL